jgi:hypothetical protein
MDPEKLSASLGNGPLWLVIGAAFGLGALGAVLHRWSSGPDTPQPGALVASPLVALVRDGLTGAVASVAILYVTAPTTAIALIGGSLVAGYAGKAVLAGLEARVVASTAKREAAVRTLEANAAKRDLDILIDRVAAVPDMSPPPPPNGGGSAGLADLQRLARELRIKRAAS